MLLLVPLCSVCQAARKASKQGSQPGGEERQKVSRVVRTAKAHRGMEEGQKLSTALRSWLSTAWLAPHADHNVLCATMAWHGMVQGAGQGVGQG